MLWTTEEKHFQRMAPAIARPQPIKSDGDRIGRYSRSETLTLTPTRPRYMRKRARAHGVAHVISCYVALLFIIIVLIYVIYYHCRSLLLVHQRRKALRG